MDFFERDRIFYYTKLHSWEKQAQFGALILPLDLKLKQQSQAKGKMGKKKCTMFKLIVLTSEKSASSSKASVVPDLANCS